MTLDERLRVARDDYRRVGDGPFADAPIRPGLLTPSRRSRWVLSAAAGIVLLAVVATLVWRAADDPDPPVSVDTDTTVTVPPPTGPPPDGDSAPLATDPAIRLEVGGPYTSGQEVELSVPSGFVDDWMNEWPVLCSTVRTSMGPSTSCDRLHALNARAGYDGVAVGSASGSDRDTRLVRLSREVFTPVGYRDCADPEVSCHVVVRRSDGTPAATARLEFGGEAPSTPVTRVEVSGGSSAGRLRVTAPDAVPSTADTDAGLGSDGWLVEVCAFGDGMPAAGPPGVVWPPGQPAYVDRPGLGSNCDTLDRPSSVESPLASGASLELDLTRELYGYGGWSDCRRQACYVRMVPLARAGTSLLPVESRAVAAPLPVDPATPQTLRPSMTIVEDGPFRVGQPLTVEVSGLPAAYVSMIGVCRTDAPMSCTYVTASLGEGTGVRRFTLLGNLDDCGEDRCFLAVQSAGEGLPAPLTVPLPVEG